MFDKSVSDTGRAAYLGMTAPTRAIAVGALEAAADELLIGAGNVGLMFADGRHGRVAAGPVAIAHGPRTAVQAVTKDPVAAL